MSAEQRLQKQDRQIRPRVVAGARERIACGWYAAHEPELLALAVVPLLDDVLAGDEQARRDEEPERWDGMS